MEPSEDHGPAVERALLTAELRHLRQAAGKRQQDAAQACDWSVSKLIRIEKGTAPLTKTDLEALLRYYEVKDEDRIRKLTERARAARQKGWWEDFKLGSDKAFLAYIGYEAGASSLRMPQSLVIPGLLQTPEYSAATLQAFQVPSEISQQVLDFRQERQRRVAGRGTKQTYILDEAVLTRPAFLRQAEGGPRANIMPAQLRHLLQTVDRSPVTIQIVPREHGLHFGLRGAFTLLGFDGLIDDVLHIENTLYGDLLISEAKEQVSNSTVPRIADPRATVRDHISGFEALQDVALDQDESLKRIEDILQELS